MRSSRNVRSTDSPELLSPEPIKLWNTSSMLRNFKKKKKKKNFSIYFLFSKLILIKKYIIIKLKPESKN